MFCFIEIYHYNAILLPPHVTKLLNYNWGEHSIVHAFSITVIPENNLQKSPNHWHSLTVPTNQITPKYGQ